tara:strand:+ start:2401 stop:3168 length:768 start_codon:yes stop_codon:yes gene_type:complete
MTKKDFSIIVQVRTGSKRLPGKVLMKYKNKSLIEIMLLRLLKSFNKEKIILTTTNLREDDILIKISKKLNIKTFRGSTNNVLERYIKTASKYRVNNIVRLTGDCPLIDPILIKKMLNIYFQKKFDYFSNCYPYNKRSFPVGSDIEIFNLKILKFIEKSKPSIYEKEHVTTKILKFYDQFNCEILELKNNNSKMRYTIDYYKDYEVIIKILDYLRKKKIYGSFKQIINFLNKNPKLNLYNRQYSKAYYKTKMKKYI